MGPGSPPAGRTEAGRLAARRDGPLARSPRLLASRTLLTPARLRRRPASTGTSTTPAGARSAGRGDQRPGGNIARGKRGARSPFRVQRPPGPAASAPRPPAALPPALSALPARTPPGASRPNLRTRQSAAAGGGPANRAAARPGRPPRGLALPAARFARTRPGAATSARPLPGTWERGPASLFPAWRGRGRTREAGRRGAGRWLLCCAGGAALGPSRPPREGRARGRPARERSCPGLSPDPRATSGSNRPRRWPGNLGGTAVCSLSRGFSAAAPSQNVVGDEGVGTPLRIVLLNVGRMLGSSGEKFLNITILYYMFHFLQFSYLK